MATALEIARAQLAEWRAKSPLEKAQEMLRVICEEIINRRDSMTNKPLTDEQIDARVIYSVSFWCYQIDKLSAAVP